MADRYVNPAVGSSGAGTSWATAYKTLKEATDAAAAGEKIYFYNASADVVTSNTTWALADGVQVISTDDNTNEPPTSYAPGATVDSSSVDPTHLINGCGSFYGVSFKFGSTNAGSYIIIGHADNSRTRFIDCEIECTSASLAVSAISVGYTTGFNQAAVFENTDFKWTSVNQYLRLRASAQFFGCNMSAGTVHPSTLMFMSNYISGGTENILHGCDLSNINTVFDGTPVGPLTLRLSQCKLKAGATVFSPTNEASGDAWVFDCDSGDSHIKMAHYNYYGSTIISESIYANDNICDSDLSWVVDGNSNATYATPYVSPWIDAYHDGTSSITPYLECVRDGSATAYDEDEIWAQLSYKGTSGSTRATLVDNMASPLGTPGANENSSKGAGDWTGEGGTAWFGKLQPNSAVTPAEAGHMRMRVFVAGNYTIYVDPQIRGLA